MRRRSKAGSPCENAPSCPCRVTMKPSWRLAVRLAEFDRLPPAVPTVPDAVSRRTAEFVVDLVETVAGQYSGPDMRSRKVALPVAPVPVPSLTVSPVARLSPLGKYRLAVGGALRASGPRGRQRQAGWV